MRVTASLLGSHSGTEQKKNTEHVNVSCDNRCLITEKLPRIGQTEITTKNLDDCSTELIAKKYHGFLSRWCNASVNTSVKKNAIKILILLYYFQ